MKNLILVAVLAVSGITQSHAQEKLLIKKVLVGSLNTAQLDPRAFGELEFKGGTVTVALNQTDKATNLIKSEISIRLNSSCSNCTDAGQVIKRTITSMTLDKECNSITYTATSDPKLLGASSSITVVDNSKNTCKYFVAIPETEITYKTVILSGQLIETSSVFSGGLLESKLKE